MPENQSVDDFVVLAEGPERNFLVRAHEAPIPLDIGGEDRGPIALDALRCHGNISLSETQYDPTISVKTVSVYERRPVTSGYRSAAAVATEIRP
jgi:hypothetical protein